jgi:hypothetical protein
MTHNPEQDGIDAYSEADERARLIREQWKSLGSPVMSKGSMGQDVPHPLLKAMHEAEVIADRLRSSVVKRHRGPAPSAVMHADLGVSPAAKLRKVG